MPKKRQNQHKKQQRALRKRTQRNRKLSRRLAQESAPRLSPRRLMRSARDMPISGAWVQQGWQEQGIARVVAARTQPNGNILFGEYIVDYFCTGLKDTSIAFDVPVDTFANEAIPRLYSGNPPLDISEELAHELIWGAIEYAGGFGFEPHRNFRDTRRILEPPPDSPNGSGIGFGYQGQPLYIPYPGDNQAAILKKLIDSVGLGNFYYLPRGDVPDEVREMLEVEAPNEVEEAPASGIWTPQQAQSGGSDTESGLWTPGQQPQPTPSEEPAEANPIWTPGR